MRVGYARTSTVEQVAGLEAQLRELQLAGCEKVFQEQVSSVGRRERLSAALEFVREGDALVVTRLCRLARSTSHLLQIVDALQSKGATLQILDLSIDTGTATGKLMLTMIGALGHYAKSAKMQSQAFRSAPIAG
jgi:DNA invertase Pin-like site-specific DNA recombinase